MSIVLLIIFCTIYAGIIPDPSLFVLSILVRNCKSCANQPRRRGLCIEIWCIGIVERCE